MNYKDEKYKNSQSLSLAGMRKNQKDKTDLSKVINDLTDFLSENHVDMVEEIILNKRDKESLVKVISDWVVDSDHSLSYSKENIVGLLMDNIIGWGELQPLIDDQEVTDIFTNEELVVIKRIKGRDILTNIVFKTPGELEHFIRAIMIRTKVKISRDHCIQDAFDHIYNVRINAGISGSPIKSEVVSKPYLALRTYRVTNFDKNFFINNGTMSQEIAEFCEKYLINYNVAVVGEPSAGKSTFIDFLRNVKNEIDPMNRVIVMEEEPELSFKSLNSIRFTERKSHGGDSVRKEYKLADHARNATRLGGRDVLIGEVRDEEAWYLVRLLDMGLKGICSVHGSSVSSGIEQLVFLSSLGAPNVKEERLVERISSVFDFIVHMSHKKVVAIAEVIGYNSETGKTDFNTIFDLRLDKNELVWDQGKLSESFIERKKVTDALHKRSV